MSQSIDVAQDFQSLVTPAEEQPLSNEALAQSIIDAFWAILEEKGIDIPMDEEMHALIEGEIEVLKQRVDETDFTADIFASDLLDIISEHTGLSFSYMMSIKVLKKADQLSEEAYEEALLTEGLDRFLVEKSGRPLSRQMKAKLRRRVSELKKIITARARGFEGPLTLEEELGLPKSVILDIRHAHNGGNGAYRREQGGVLAQMIWGEVGDAEITEDEQVLPVNEEERQEIEDRFAQIWMRHISDGEEA